MNSLLVGRPINGITLNGLEYLLSEDGTNVLRFQNEDTAQSFLRVHGVTDEQMEWMRFIETEEEMALD